MEGLDYLMVSFLVVLYASLYIIFKHIILLSKKIEQEYCDSIFFVISKK